MSSGIEASVIAIFSDEKPPMVQVGTAILVSHRNTPFIVTAKHILTDNGEKNGLYFVFKGFSYPLNFPAFVSKSDHLDFAFIPLLEHPKLLQYLKQSYQPISLEDFQNPENYTRSHYLVYGFPSNKTEITKHPVEIELVPFQLITDQSTDDTLFHKYDKTKDSHIILEYNKMIKKQDGIRNTGPDPYGVSGGPVFKIFVNEEDDGNTDLILIGVAIEWRSKKHIIATLKHEIRDDLESYLMQY